MIVLSRIRAVLEANTDHMVGIPLEDIPPGFHQGRPGVVLISKDWTNFYFLKKRDGWKEDDYFKWAEELFIKRGILEP